MRTRYGPFTAGGKPEDTTVLNITEQEAWNSVGFIGLSGVAAWMATGDPLFMTPAIAWFLFLFCVNEMD